MLTFEELVLRVLLSARELTPRQTIELGVFHGLCLDVAEDLAPELIDQLQSVEGLKALVPILDKLPTIVLPLNAEKGLWQFVKTCE